jgi:predicted transposase YbfD/YdcC
MKILELLEVIPDPRQEGKVVHNLSAILFTTLCAVLCGAESWSDVADYCETKFEWLKLYVNLEGGVPTEWTYRRVFTLIKPEFLEQLLTCHAKSLLNTEEEQHIAIDGKALRGSQRHNLRCLHSISAMCHESGIILSEAAVNEKSNEITAIPLLLDVLELKGNTVTIDAAGCQQNIVKTIVERQGYYVLGLKKNQRKLHEKISTYMQSHGIQPEYRLEDEFDMGHGRRVRRRYFACNIEHLPGADQWPGLKTAIATETIRQVANTGEVRAEWRYYITNHDPNNSKLPQMVRNHWGIENKVHWVLDVHMNEDQDRKAEQNSAKAFRIFKRMTLNIARSKETKPKQSLRRKLKCAGWSEDALLHLLS